MLAFITRATLGLGLLAITPQAIAQEVVSPLHAIPRGNAPQALKAGGLNEVFNYDNAAQTIPVVDDFSVDRTRHLSAQSSDANVTLTETIYQLVAGGISTPDMVYVNDTSFHITFNTQNDTLIVTQVANPAVVVIVRDLSVYPVTEQSMFLWPPYTVVDTVNDATTDTLALEGNRFQDSLLVYSVAADARTYINPDNSTRPWVLWADDDAYINGTFPLNPPTIGVATLDGLDRTGYPYAPEAPNSNGLADHLTSVPINLAFAASDSIYLSFLCEPVGRSGDTQQHDVDSLRLEFFAPDQNAWYRIWATSGIAAVDTFRNVMIPIKEAQYLKSNFRFRFSNDATLGGAVDQWHIDYVRLDRNRNVNDVVLKDVAYVYPEAGLLNNYTSVPYAKFIQAPASYMANSVDLVQRNNDTQDKFITWGYGVTSDCGWSTTRANYGNNISNNAQTSFTTTHPVNSGANPLVYDVSGCADAAFLTTKFWTNATPDALAYNDTATFRQQISNYYSYDDGSAEAGYSVGQGGGSKLAYQFDTQGSDSLRALRMYFDPIFTYNGTVNDPNAGSFIITVWSSLNPETIIYQNVSFSNPQYKTWGPDYFVEYPLDSTIAVNGTFYVGWVQTNNTELQLGLDRNRDNHDKMFYNTGQSWATSSISGSWMIRPVVVASVDPYASVEEMAAPAEAMTLYPNPAGNEFQVRWNGTRIATLQLLDPTGRLVRSWAGIEGTMAVGDLAPGLYLLRAVSGNGSTLAQSRLMVQH
ncbi:MAG: T9SS type A sorting domain-containing protein [Flavobacteriales bacterium]